MIADLQISQAKGTIAGTSLTILADNSYLAVWGFGTLEGNQYYTPTSIKGQLLDPVGNKIGMEVTFVTDTYIYFPHIQALSNNDFVFTYEKFISTYNEGNSLYLNNYELKIAMFNVYEEHITFIKECDSITFSAYQGFLQTSYFPHHDLSRYISDEFVVTWYEFDQSSKSGILLSQKFASDCSHGDKFKASEKPLPKFATINSLTINDNQFVTLWGSKYNTLAPIYPAGIHGSWFSNGVMKPFEIDRHYDLMLDTTVLANGRVAIVWTTEETDPHGYGHIKVYKNIFDSNFNSLHYGEVILEGVSYTQSPYFISLSGTKDGGFILTYQVYRFSQNDYSNVFGQYFDNDGIKQGHRITINTVSNHNQHISPMISHFNHDKALVMWVESLNENTGNEDVLMGNFINLGNHVGDEVSL